MSLSFLFGLLFACAGLSLFLAQVITVELWRAYRGLRDAINTLFQHDTDIMVDYVHPIQPDPL
jgi:hypothetical protein